MIFKVIFIIAVAAPDTFGTFTPSTETYVLMALVPTLNIIDFLDGPASISHASTTPKTNSEPTLAQMKYYNYYAASMYCQYQLNDLSCDYCRKFKNDVYNHTGNCNSLCEMSFYKCEVFS